MIKSPSQAGRQGIEVLLQKGRHETRALACLEECWSWGQLSVQQHTGTPMTMHHLEPCPFKPSIQSQVVPILVPGPSKQGLCCEGIATMQ